MNIQFCIVNSTSLPTSPLDPPQPKKVKLKTEEDRCKELKRNLDERDARASATTVSGSVFTGDLPAIYGH